MHLLRAKTGFNNQTMWNEFSFKILLWRDSWDGLSLDKNCKQHDFHSFHNVYPNNDSSHSKLESDTKIVQEIRECYDINVHGDGFEATKYQNSLQALMQECHPVLRELFRILARSLDLNDEDFFVNSVRCLNHPEVSSLTTLRSTYYPPIPDGIPEGSTRCEEHADYGLLTLLFQDDIGGLEVRWWRDISAASISLCMLLAPIASRGRY